MPETDIPQDSLRRESVGSSISSLASFNFNIPNQLNEHHQDLFSPIQLSFDSDAEIEPNMNEDDLTQPYLLPIILPVEPTLHDLLLRITDREDLHNVQEIKLHVISSMVSLSQLPVFMPYLTSLDLDGSVLYSLRDLGYGHNHLVTLNVSNCGLSSLDGTNAFHTLKKLIADGNRIEFITPVTNLRLLEILSLKNNKIRTVEVLSFLSLCPLIKDLNVEGNPVTNKPTYREDIKKKISSLEILNDVSISEGINTEDSLSITNSSLGLHSDSSLSLWEELHNVQEKSFVRTEDRISRNVQNSFDRPSTSQGIIHRVIMIETVPRPKTADFIITQRSLISCEPISGSIIGAVRQRKKKQKKVVSGSVAQSSKSGSSNNLESFFDK